MSIRGLLFDKDGTLIDCDLTWAPVLLRLATELQPNADVDRLVEAAGLDISTGRLRAGSVWAAGSTRDLVALWWPEADEATEAALARCVDAICAEMGPKTSVPLLDLAAFFDGLAARGFAIGIATNDSTASARGFLDVHGLADRVPHVFGYDSVAATKPAPDMVHAFARATGLEAPEVAVVGDNVHDLEMARAAGALAVGVLSGNGGLETLAAHADLVIEGAADLVSALARHQAEETGHVL